MWAKTLSIQVSLLFATIAWAGTFDPLHHSGAAAPYFEAPPRFRVSNTVPAGCVVDQAAYIVRHGSRYPEPGSFQGWVNLYNKLQNASYNASGSVNWLPSWTLPVDDQPHQPLFLTDHGSMESFQLGAQLRGRYGFTKGGDNITVWSAGQQRVIDTATNFVRGYLSQGNYLTAPTLNRASILVMPDSVNNTGADSLTASAACPNYSGNNGSTAASAFRASYQGAIADRLNKHLQGLTLNATDIGVMQDLCGFEFVINGDKKWCELFEKKEWLNYEYAHDLNYYYGSGPGNPLAGTTAYPWLKAITQLLVNGPSSANASNGTFTPPNLIMGFTHDNDIPPVVAALGILNSSSDPHVYPLSLTKPNPKRTFYASNMVSFLGHVALERLSCEAPLSFRVQHAAGKLTSVPGTGANATKYVRVLVNDMVVPLPTCASGPGASCPLSDFVKYVDNRQAVLGDFVQRCGLSNVTNSPDVVDFYMNPTSTAANVTKIDLPVM